MKAFVVAVIAGLGLAGGVAHADPADIAPYAAVRFGVTDWHDYQRDSNGEYRGTAPTLELAAGAWLMPWLSLAAVAAGFRDSGVHADGGPTADYHVALGKLGARATFELPQNGVLLGFGLGLSVLRSNIDQVDGDAGTGTRNDYGEYVELLAGVTLVRYGSLALQLQGELSAGETLDASATLGLAWDPQTAQTAQTARPVPALRAPRSWPDGLTGSVMIGWAHGGERVTPDDDGDPVLAAWSPALDVELGERISPRLALLATAGYKALIHTQFEEYDAATDDGLDRYSSRIWRAGVRAQLWLVPRLFVAGGVGYAEVAQRDDVVAAGQQPFVESASYGGAYVEGQLGIPLVAVGPVQLQIANTIGIGANATWAAFSVGLAWRKP